MTFLLNLFGSSATSVLLTLSQNWPFLLVSALIAGFLKVYMDQRTVAAVLRRDQKRGVVGATAVAVTTPLCSCGTTAVILGMMANLLPWAPVVAFMVASPLTSPQELIYSAGLFGWPFALAFFTSSILLGLLGGLTAYQMERRGWLMDQARFRPVVAPLNGVLAAAASEPVMPRWQLALRESASAGWKLLAFFVAFAFIGYLLNGLLPPNLVSTLFGGRRIYGVPLAATLGLPLYVNTEASLPLVRSLLDLGMSPGAALAFLITGAGTSIGAIAGALTIARWRVVGTVVGTLWAGGIALGYAYNLLLQAGAL